MAEWAAARNAADQRSLRQRSSFQPNSLEVVGEVLQHRQQRFRFGATKIKQSLASCMMPQKIKVVPQRWLRYGLVRRCGRRHRG